MYKYYGNPDEMTVDQWYCLWPLIGFYEEQTRVKNKQEFLAELAKQEAEKQKFWQDKKISGQDYEKVVIDMVLSLLKGRTQ